MCVRVCMYICVCVCVCVVSGKGMINAILSVNFSCTICHRP